MVERFKTFICCKIRLEGHGGDNLQNRIEGGGEWRYRCEPLAAESGMRPRLAVGWRPNNRRLFLPGEGVEVSPRMEPYDSESL